MYNIAINQLFLKVSIVRKIAFTTVQCKKPGEITFKDGYSQNSPCFSIPA